LIFYFVGVNISEVCPNSRGVCPNNKGVCNLEANNNADSHGRPPYLKDLILTSGSSHGLLDVWRHCSAWRYCDATVVRDVTVMRL